MVHEAVNSFAREKGLNCVRDFNERMNTNEDRGLEVLNLLTHW